MQYTYVNVQVFLLQPDQKTVGQDSVHVHPNFRESGLIQQDQIFNSSQENHITPIPLLTDRRMLEHFESQSSFPNNNNFIFFPQPSATKISKQLRLQAIRQKVCKAIETDTISVIAMIFINVKNQILSILILQTYFHIQVIQQQRYYEINVTYIW